MADFNLAEFKAMQSWNGGVMTKPNRSQSERECREEFGRTLDETDAILEKAAKEGRDLTADEKATTSELQEKLRGLSRAINVLAEGWRSDVSSVINTIAQGGESLAAERKTDGWIDARSGARVPVLAKGDRWADLSSSDKPAPRFGELMRCIVTGDRSNATPEIRAALSEGSNNAGGFLVSGETMAAVIDLARAKSAVMQAGAVMVPMKSDELTLARVSEDPSFQVKAENNAFVGSGVSFDAIHFSAFTVGTMIVASRELAEDAPNFPQLIETTLANAWAAKFDHIAINGVAGTSLDGILDWETGGIGETGSVAAIAWEDIHNAVVGVQMANFEPNAYIINPDIAGDLSILASGDGTNSAKMWLGPPPGVAPLTQLRTTNIGTGSAIIGQFNQLVFGLRKNFLIESTTMAGDFFSRHQVAWKLVCRFDVNAFRRDAFHRLVGITT